MPTAATTDERQFSPTAILASGFPGPIFGLLPTVYDDVSVTVADAGGNHQSEKDRSHSSRYFLRLCLAFK